MAVAGIISLAGHPVRGLQASAAATTNEQTREQGSAAPRYADGRGGGAVLPLAFLVGQVTLPGDISGQSVANQDLPLRHRYPPRLGFSRPTRIERTTSVRIGAGVDRVAEDEVQARQSRPPPLQLPPPAPPLHAEAE